MDNGLKTSHAKISNNPRIGAIDSIRGLAIAAIFLIHTSNHFLFNEFPPSSSGFIASLDSGIRSMLYFLFEGKAYTIFALLFGFSCALQLDKKRYEANSNSKTRMVCRLFVLILFGIMNAALFAGGDPLVFYAIAMLMLIPIATVSTKILGALATIFLVIAINPLNPFFTMSGDCYADYAVVTETLRTGNFLDTIWTNVTYGISGCLRWALETGRSLQTLGLFLIGMIAYRKRLFDLNMQWSKYWHLYIVLTVALYFVKIHLLPSVTMYYNLMFSLSLFAVYFTLYHKFSGKGLFQVLTLYGRMSLTNFIAQSLLGALIYYPWAFNLAPKLSVTYSVLITIGLIVLQILFSSYWLKRRKKGPLESLWNRLTELITPR